MGSDSRAPGDQELFELSERVGRQLHGAGRRIATAESCTAGWVAKALTDVAGSSQWFECGYVTYSNAAKMRDLGVSERTLARHGAVSEETVREMAAGALRVSGGDVAVAISGIAGPDGGVPGKPVGTVWFAVAVVRITASARSPAGSGLGDAGGPAGVRAGGAASPTTDVISEVELFPGDREQVRRLSVQHALGMVLRSVSNGGVGVGR